MEPRERSTELTKALADAAGLREVAGRQTGELPEGLPHEVIHRDDLVVLP